MNTLRQYSPLDQLVMGFDGFLRAANKSGTLKIRPNPAISVNSDALTVSMRRQSACLMRVNHSGEVSAQALYQGQAITANNPRVQIIMQDSATEEIDHLYWCQQRLDELESHTSYLNPLWYAGSFTLGAMAGYMGDEWSLGFVAETENQVVQHIDEHLERLPELDVKSRAILEQMKLDEGKHATMAKISGARELPEMVKKLMSLCSKVMTKSSYWV
ncbi:MAG: ubiquinone biosynthesis monooxygenase Coq7 [Gammaproteobacteria bacterium]|jgi:ubiquinone biosynthesis monooxygenase Coq7